MHAALTWSQLAQSHSINGEVSLEVPISVYKIFLSFNQSPPLLFSPPQHYSLWCTSKKKLEFSGWESTESNFKVNTRFSPSSVFYFAIFIFSHFSSLPSPLRNFAWKQTWNLTAFVLFSLAALILTIHNFEFFVVIEPLLYSSVSHPSGWETDCNTDTKPSRVEEATWPNTPQRNLHMSSK